MEIYTTDETLKFEDDNLYHYYKLPQYGEGISKKDLVMTKEIFIECYNNWILKDAKDIDVYDKDTVRWMFKELLLEINRKEKEYRLEIDDVKELIQRRINALEVKDGNNN